MMEFPEIDTASWFYKNCKRQRARGPLPRGH